MRNFRIINLERFIKNRVVREWVEALIFALLVALVFRTWFYSTFKVPTGSMIPTIQIGDHLMADMHAYGLVVPFTEIKLFASSVEKGDIVIFPSPRDASVDLIKRVIAVEGDRVEIAGETIYVNGQPEKQDHLYFNQYYRPVVFSSNFAVPKQFVVPTGKVWTLGDNRRNSMDGRFWGFVDRKDIRAKGLFVHWNHDPHQSLFSGYQVKRIGTWLN